MWRVADLDAHLPEGMTVWEDVDRVELRCEGCGGRVEFTRSVTREALLNAAWAHDRRARAFTDTRGSRGPH